MSHKHVGASRFRYSWSPELLSKCLSLCQGFIFIPGESNWFSSIPSYEITPHVLYKYEASASRISSHSSLGPLGPPSSSSPSSPGVLVMTSTVWSSTGVVDDYWDHRWYTSSKCNARTSSCISWVSGGVTCSGIYGLSCHNGRIRVGSSNILLRTDLLPPNCNYQVQSVSVSVSVSELVEVWTKWLSRDDLASAYVLCPLNPFLILIYEGLE